MSGCQVAFIGCGRVARFHADALVALGVSISAVCGRASSPNAPAFAERYSVPRIYDSWQTLLEREQPHALWIAASWNEIDSLLLPMVESGIPCLIEKPAGLTSARLREALLARDRRNTGVLVGYNRRFYDFVPRLRDLLASDTLKAVEVHLPEPLSAYDPETDAALMRSLWLVKCSHVLDLLCHLLGPLSIRILSRTADDVFHIPTAFNGLLETRGNVPVHLIANWGAPDSYRLVFHCRRSLVKVSPIERMQVFEGLAIEGTSPEHTIRTYSPRMTEERIVDATYKPGFYAQAENFLETCVRKRQPNVIGCTLEQALELTELCEAIRGDA